jgi:hypothetical protein
MRKKREFVDGAAYHVISRTNDKMRVFERRVGKKVMDRPTTCGGTVSLIGLSKPRKISGR